MLLIALSGCGVLTESVVLADAGAPQGELIARVQKLPAGQATPADGESVTDNNLYSTPTPVPGGGTVTLTPDRDEVGWWGSGRAGGRNIGDSYLYAGYYSEQAFVSAVLLDVSILPRGAEITEATLRLTGLSDRRLYRDVAGTWTIQLLEVDALEDLSRADFQDVINAPAAITLLPALYAKDLNAEEVNSWKLDRDALAWLEQQVLDENTDIIARISGPVGGADSLFAWDSGYGPTSQGDAPQLIVSLGPPPATPPPRPSPEVIVANMTLTPANVLTAAARSLAATEQATRWHSDATTSRHSDSNGY